MIKKKFRLKIIVGLLFLILFIFTAGHSYAFPDRVLVYKGQLRDSAGQAVADSSYAVTFSIYTSSSGGSSIWSESQSISTKNGVFGAVLGSSNPINFDFNSGRYYLGIKVGSDSEMSPRQTIGAAPFALNSQKLNGFTEGTGPDNILKLGSGGQIDIAGYIKTSGTLQAGSSTLSALIVQNDAAVNNNLTVNNDLTVLNSITAPNIIYSVSGSGAITSSGGQNPTIGLSATWGGQTSINTVGTITTGTWNGSTISDTYISALSGGSQGDILYHNGSGWTQLSAGTSGQYLRTGGPSGIPYWNGVSGTVPAGTTNNSILTWNSGIPSWNENTNYLIDSFGNVISGTWTASQIADTYISALNGGVQGDILYHNGTNFVKLSPGISGYFLQTNGAGSNPSWNSAPGTTYSAGDGLDLVGTVFSVDLLSTGGLAITASELGILLDGSTLSLSGAGLKVADSYDDNFLTTATSFSGDVSGTYNSTVVANDSHTHTGATLSGIDISDDTNLAVSDPITLIDDTVGLNYNTTNLKLTTSALNTIQDIATTSSPTFSGLTLSSFGVAGYVKNDASGNLSGGNTIIAGDIPTSDLIQGTGVSLSGTLTNRLVGSGSNVTIGVSSNVPTSVTNDTNVTGSIAGNVLTLGWQGQLSVTRGGTGAGSFTQYGLLYGNNTGSLQATAAGATGQILVGNTGAAPSWSSQSAIDHGLLSGLADDDHLQYALLAGRAGGQYLYGGTAASENLTLESTSNGTKGYVLIQPNGGNVGIGTTGPDRMLDVLDASNPQIRLTQTDGTVYTDLKTDSIGNLTISPTGGTTKLLGINSTASQSSEMITNQVDHDFSGAPNWTGTGWSLSGGVWVHTAGANNTTLDNSFLSSAPASGKIYQINATITTTTAGTINANIGGVNGSKVGQTTGTLSQHTWVIYATGSGALTFVPNGVWVGSIDDISVIEITPSVAVESILNSDSTIGIELRSGGSGLNNSFIGLGAGQSNTTGTNNSAMGMNTLRSNTTGSYNSAMGVFSLNSNTTGSYNSAMGVFSLNSNTTGGYNSAMGPYALNSNTTGSYNSAMGLFALNSNTTGSYNSAMGLYALNSNTTGRYNSAMGIHALSSNTTGNYNSAMGVSALSWNTTGTYNSALGNGALGNNSTGSNNIGLGYDADVGYYPTSGFSLAATVNAGNVDTGSHYYKVSYVVDGIETETSLFKSVNVSTAPPNSRVDLSGIPTYTGGRTCTARKIYRTKLNDSSNYYLVAAINDNVTTTYNDTAADSTLSTLQVGPSSSIAIGRDAAFMFGNQLVFGGADYGVTDSYFGEGIENSTPISHILHATSGAGTNIAGGSLTLAAGQSTGSGVGGDLIFSTSAPGGAGITLNALSERMRITDDGNVGIGITSPGQKLSVAGNLGIQAGAGYLIFQGGAQSADRTYTWPNDYPAVNGYVLSSNTGGGLSWISPGGSSLWTDGGDYLRPTSYGDAVRIGTDASNYISIDYDTDAIIALQGTTVLKPSANDSYDLGSDSFRWANIYLGGETIHMGTSGNDAAISYYTATNSLGITNTAADLKFGIGTMSPQETLEVVGAVKIGTTAASNAGTIRWNGANFQGYNGSVWLNLDISAGSGYWTLNGTNLYPNSTSYNVGIGTTTTLANMRLYVVSSGRTYPALVLSGGSSTFGGSTDGQIIFGTSPTDQASITYANSGNDMYIDNMTNSDSANILFRTKASATPVNALTILGSGEVGIGTSEPANLLTIAGGTSVGSGYTATAAPSNGMIIQGNVGIGTKTITSTLNVYRAADLPQLTLARDYGNGVVVDFTAHSNRYLEIATSAADNGTVLRIANTNSRYSDFRINASGNLGIFSQGTKVGINTIQPGAILDVYLAADTPQLRLTRDTGNGVVVDFTAHSNRYLEIATSAADYNTVLKLTNGAGKYTNFKIDAWGDLQIAPQGERVAIGDNLPSAMLEITHATIPQLELSLPDGTNSQLFTTAGGILNVKTTAADYKTVLRLTNDTGKYTDFKIDAWGDLQIAPQGEKVAIGGNLPAAMLDITHATYPHLQLTLPDHSKSQLFTTAGGILNVKTSAADYNTVLRLSNNAGRNTDFKLDAWDSLIIAPGGGRVGIGDRLPDATLEVTDGSIAQLRLSQSGGTYTDFQMINNSTYAALFINPYFGFSPARIGIGTTTPRSYLSVASNMAIGATYASTNAAPANGLIVQGNVGIKTATAANFTLEVGGHIGPSANQTYDLGSSSYQWRNSYAQSFVSYTAGGGLHLYNSTTPTYGANVGMAVPAATPVPTNDLLFSTYAPGGWKERMRLVTSTGFLGIGTASPTNPLTIDSDSGLGIAQLALRDTRAYSVAPSSWLLFNGKYDATNYTTFSQIGGAKENTTSGNTSGNMRFYINSGSGMVERLTILSSGNVGIGTSGPAKKLHIIDTTSINGSLKFFSELKPGVGTTALDFGANNLGTEFTMSRLRTYLATGSVGIQDTELAFETMVGGTLAERMRIDDSGNVGIGTASPAVTLDVNGIINAATGYRVANAASSGTFLRGNGTNYVSGTIQSSDVSSFAYIQNGNSFGANAVLGTNDNYTLAFETNNTARMTIDTAGNVGIGTSAPTNFKLEVAGSIGPSTDNTYDLGSTAKRWRKIELGPGSLDITSTTGTSGAGANYTLGSLYFSGTDFRLATSQVGSGFVGSIRVTTGSNTGLNIDSSGNIGINNASPVSMFSVGSSSQFQVNSTGAIAAATGITNTGIITSTGGIVNLNVSSNFAVNIAAGSSTGAVSIGGGSNTVSINSNDWDISTTGAMTGISGINNNGSYTQSGTGANTFTGTSTFSNGTYSAIFTGGNVGIGTSTPAALFSVGSASGFQVNSSGDIIRIKGQTYVWPSSYPSGTSYLKNDGSGGLSWDTLGSSSTITQGQFCNIGSWTTIPGSSGYSFCALSAVDDDTSSPAPVGNNCEIQWNSGTSSWEYRASQACVNVNCGYICIKF